MSLDEFKTLLLTVDPKATKRRGGGTGDRTVWRPTSVSDRLMSDDSEEEVVWTVYIDRFTKSDTDTIASAIYTALENAHIPFTYIIDDEPETGYIHHIFTCIVG